jgi:hypothetical protein
VDPWESDERITIEPVLDGIEQHSTVRRAGVRHPRRWLAAVVATVALLVVLTRLGGAPVAPSIASAPARPPAAPPGLGGVVPTVAVGPVVVGPQRPIGSITGIVLYLTPAAGAPTSLIAYDVDRGVGHRIDLGLDVGWYLGAVEGAGGVVLDGGRVLRLAGGGATPLDGRGGAVHADAPFGRVAAGPAGGVWVRQLDPPIVSLIDHDGVPTGVQFDLPLGAELFGSMADGTPVVRGADGGVATVEASGDRPRLAANAVAPVRAGRFAEIRCDAQQACGLVGHVKGREIPLGPVRQPTGTARAVEFQTNGPYVAVVEDGRLSLHDTETGRVRHDIVQGVISGPGGRSSGVRFLPGSAGLAASTSGGIALIGLNGRVRATLPFATADLPGPQLLGAGRATPWTAS